MNKPMMTLYNLVFPLFFLIFFIPDSYTQITVDNFMGANSRRQDPIDKMRAVGFIREYHEWFLNEGNLNNSNPPDYSLTYPNALYKWNEAYQNLTYTRFDEFYEEMQDSNIIISPTFLGNLFQLVDPLNNLPYSNEIILEQKPVAPGADTLDPASYIAHAAYLYHYAARYGHNTFSSNHFNDIIVPVTHPSETPKSGLGYVEYMEDWNEQDKFWYRDFNGNFETYFSPESYATMLSADYDGHEQTLGLVIDPDNPSQMISAVGIKNADPNMKVVIGGIAVADLDYFRGIVDWAKTNRSTSAIHGQLPFDVLNIHKYTGNDPNFFESTHGVSPEEAGLRAFLKKFDDYRDSLNTAFGVDLELWLSEFGYDTYDNSAGALGNVVAPPIDTNDTYEVQGQWIVRTYLEALAAEVDRAMMYDLRDICSAPNPSCGLFSSSGLLENAAKNYKPKKSWYYTYTMKNMLEGMVFDIDMSSCPDTNCVRVFRFVEADGGNKRVYAIWSPTSSAKHVNFLFDKEEAEDGVLVNMELPSVHGVSSIIEDENPTIHVTERPLFIIIDHEGDYFMSPTCTANLVTENPTCGTINVRLNAPDNMDKYQLWYMEDPTGSLTASDFSLSTAILVNDELMAIDSSITVPNLEPDSTYTFFLFPEGVSYNEADKICTVTGSTLVATTNCYLPVQASWIFDEYKNNFNPNGLFDEQGSFDPLCNPSNVFPSSLWGFNFENDIRSVSLDLQSYYYIDAFTLHDEGSEGIFTIQIADSPNGPWTTVTEYLTVGFNVWKTITNAIPLDKPIRYLKFIAEASDKAKVGELYICGRPSSFMSDNLPGISKNPMITGITCETIDLQWEDPFDTDIQGYKIIYGGNVLMPTYNPSGTQSFQITGLMASTTYEFKIVTIDDANQESVDSLKIVATTNALGECDLVCNHTCSCAICLRESWIINLTPTIEYHAENLVDEQEKVPFCDGTANNPSSQWGWDFDPNNGPPPAIIQIDLQKVYDLSIFHFFDQGGSGGDFKVEYFSTSGQWIQFVAYHTGSYAWQKIENLNIQTRYLRLTQLDNNARIGEIGICGTIAVIDDCPANLDLPDPIVQSDTFSAGIITSSAILDPNIEIGYFAETEVLLTAGFTVPSNTVFLAKIEACPNVLVENANLDFSKIQILERSNNSQNNLSIYPNPFQYSTTLAYRIETATVVQLDIFNASGKRINILINNQLMPKGSYQVQFKSKRRDGVYIARLQIGEEVFMKKMVLIGG